jgi:hypothetical protein
MWIHDRRLIFALGAIWISAVSIGVGKLMAYENTPAKTAVLGPAWPSDSQLKTQPDRFTLVMSVHPHCPCSRASLDELAIIASRCRQLSINLLFTQPSSASPEWVKSSQNDRRFPVQRSTAIQASNLWRNCLVQSVRTTGVSRRYNRCPRSYWRQSGIEHYYCLSQRSVR